MKKLRILIVDDSQADVERASGFLQTAGHEVLVARDGQSGLDTAKSQLPDLILMDVVMPGLNGFQATRQLNRDESTRHIPVIVVSGKDQETDKVWALRQGAKAYITKALEKQSLLKTIEQVMG